MIAAPAARTLFRFELVRRARARSSLLALTIFVGAEAAFRVLTRIDLLDTRDGMFVITYLAALILILRFDLVEDRETSFDEALAANGVAPRGYIAAKLAATVVLVAGFTLACLVASMTAGGVAPAIAVREAARAFLVAWLLSPLALAVEAVSEMRLPTAVAYLFAIGAIWGLWQAGRLLDVTDAIGLTRSTPRDLARLLLTDALVVTPILLLVAWLAVARRLRTIST